MTHDATANGEPTPVPDSPAAESRGALLTGHDAAAHINRRLDSREWWLFVTCERRGTAFCSYLERTYYAGEANKDFEVVVLPALPEGFGVVGLFLARKSRLPAEWLRREIAESVGPISEEELRTRDVIFPHPDVKVARALAEFVVEFLARRRPEVN